MKKGRLPMATPFHPRDGRDRRSNTAVQLGLMVSGTLALFAVFGVLAFGGPF
jgi:hypothetical protein